MQTPHEPIRHDLARMERLLQAPFFDGTQEWKAAAFFKWYNDWFYPNVSPHFELYFPLAKPLLQSLSHNTIWAEECVL